MHGFGIILNRQWKEVLFGLGGGGAKFLAMKFEGHLWLSIVHVRTIKRLLLSGTEKSML